MRRTTTNGAAGDAYEEEAGVDGPPDAPQADTSWSQGMAASSGPWPTWRRCSAAPAAARGASRAWPCCWCRRGPPPSVSTPWRTVSATRAPRSLGRAPLCSTAPDIWEFRPAKLELRKFGRSRFGSPRGDEVGPCMLTSGRLGGAGAARTWERGPLQVSLRHGRSGLGVGRILAPFVGSALALHWCCTHRAPGVHACVSGGARVLHWCQYSTGAAPV